MKLSGAVKKDVLEAYETYWSNYLRGDTAKIISLLDSEVTMIGSSEIEVFYTKEDASGFFKSSAGEIAGKVDMRNRQIEVLPLEGYFLIIELMDVYVLTGKEWSFYSKGRNSTLMQKKPDGWKIIHKHGSVPDMRTKGGESFAFEQISKENIELRHAVERRTAELKQKNRQLEINAALERIRSSTMAMRKSTDMLELIKAFTSELQQLGIKIDTANFDTSFEKKNWDLLMYNPLYSPVPYKMHIPFFDHPFFQKALEAIEEKDIVHTAVFDKETKDRFLDHLYTNTVAKAFPDERKKDAYSKPGFAWSFVVLRNTSVTISNYDAKPYTEEENHIFLQFAHVFDQSYTRFLDLQKAETHMELAQRQASLDRIRADVASMRDAEDLQKITPIIWKELKSFNVPFFRCGVYIINEATRKIDLYLSTPDGSHLASLQMDFDQTETGRQTVANWRRQSVYIEQWNKEQFIEWVDSLVNRKVIEKASTYFEGVPETELLKLHFVPFKQGMLYVGSAEFLNDSHLNLIKLLADAFSIAYTRYEDFKKQEEAKSQIEQTLAELKAAQVQLVHAEKMASLGELTAGIAHEIQNPLNFVNNFSELNYELLAEMKTAIDQGKLEEAKQLAADVIENEHKIKHHGKRADSIVKSMLHHSRSSSRKKEMVDINALADEYLRLCYHGLRAKDSSFQANFETSFDEQAGEVNIVPQEIGRVLLNVLNNAFFAVTERRKQTTGSYDPLVKVSTRKLDGEIEIVIADNGMGIPKDIADKIFQPFFTTKPTGQGTGLGLSLSYDIIKAHGGKLEVHTEPGKGSEFIVRLPVQVSASGGGIRR